MKSKSLLKRSVAAALSLAMMFAMAPLAAFAAEPNQPDTWADHADASWFTPGELEYEIETAEQLAGIGLLRVSGLQITLKNDIDLSAYNWMPISKRTGFCFGGDLDTTAVFDGAGHTITGLKIDVQASDFKGGDYINEEYENYASIGLFGRGAWAEIKNLTVENPEITVTNENDHIGYSVGVIVGVMEDASQVIGCEVIGGTINATNAGNATCYVGGIAGAMFEANNLTATWNGSVEDCSSEVDVTVNKAENMAVGGIVGGVCVSKGAAIKDCTVTGQKTVGTEDKGYLGIVGNAEQSTAIIEGCKYIVPEGKDDNVVDNKDDDSKIEDKDNTGYDSEEEMKEGKELTEAAFTFNIPNNAKYKGAAHPIAVTGVYGVGKITVKYNGKEDAPVDAGTYAVTVDVEKGEVYKAGTGIKLGEFTIAPADLTVTDAKATAQSGQTLADIVDNIDGVVKFGDIKVDGTFAWADGVDTTVIVGNNTYKAKFTPSSANYNAINDIDVAVTVSEYGIVLSMVDQLPTSELEHDYATQKFTVKIENKGPEIIVKKTNISLTNSAFEIETDETVWQDNQITIAPNGSEEFELVFNAGKAAGKYTTSITVKAEDSLERVMATNTLPGLSLTVKSNGTGGQQENPPAPPTPSTPSGGSSGGGGGTSYRDREIKDDATGITVKGSLSSSTSKLKVAEMKLHNADECEACKAIAEAQTQERFIAGYDLSFTTSTSVNGKVTVTVPVKDRANGDVLVLQCNNKKLETIKSVIADGTVKFETSKLSMFAIVETDPEAENYENPFEDVKENDWFNNDVKYVYLFKLMNGTSDTKFEPTKATTRAMIVTILWRLEGEPKSSINNTFADVADGQWYAEAVKWAAQNSIVTGYSQTAFGPNDNLTREQMAVILYRFAQYKKYDVTKTTELTDFNDSANVSSWALAAVKWAVAEGLITGTGSGIVPQGDAQRAQTAAILHRYVENIANKAN